jgi:Ricin-type beta-trefoil lectin domain
MDHFVSTAAPGGARKPQAFPLTDCSWNDQTLAGVGALIRRRRTAALTEQDSLCLSRPKPRFSRRRQRAWRLPLWAPGHMTADYCEPAPPYGPRVAGTAEGLCMDSYGGGASPGTRVDWYTCHAGFPSQEWALSGNQIVSGESGLCLQEDGTTSGDQLELENCDATNDAQIWAPSTVERYENRASSLCLDDPDGSTTPSTFADVDDCSGGASQQFTYNPETRALAAEGLCLNSYDGESRPGTRVDLYTCSGAGFPSQQWTLNSSDQIVSGESGLCLQEDGTTSGDELELEKCDASNQAQQWSRRH